MAFPGGFNGAHEARLALSATRRLTSGTLATAIGVAQPDEAGQLVSLVWLQHHQYALLFYVPGGVVGDTQMASQLHAGDALFVLDNAEDGQEPHGKDQHAGIVYGAGSLLAAAVVLL